MLEIVTSVITFTLIILILLLFVLAARKALVPAGTVVVNVNHQIDIEARPGDRLLDILKQSGINVPGACGGAGTCGLCKVVVDGSEVMARPQEKALLTRTEIMNGTRLACQVSIRQAMDVVVDDTCLTAQRWDCEVQSTRSLSTLIKEIVIKLPDDAGFRFQPGNFVEITCPPYRLQYSDIEIAPAYQSYWDGTEVRSLQAGTDEPVTRAYSMANHPDDQGIIRLNVRIALPPPGSEKLPPGIVSSWLFSLKPGDRIAVAGCFGHFQVDSSDREAVFVGGGVGLAPLYAQIMDLFHRQKTQRKISLWYGARSKKELFYQQDLQTLADNTPNFSLHVSLSEPEPEDNWSGATGFIHQSLQRDYLDTHPSPEDCEYYLCGPPLMVRAVFSMLDNFGVDSDHIHHDDFGGG